MTKDLDQLQALQAKLLELVAEVAQLKMSFQAKYSQETSFGKPTFSQALTEQQSYNKLFKAFSKEFRNSSFAKHF